MQGALLDGEQGFAMAKPTKVVQYCQLGFELLMRGESTLKELQVVCGVLCISACLEGPCFVH